MLPFVAWSEQLDALAELEPLQACQPGGCVSTGVAVSASVQACTVSNDAVRDAELANNRRRPAVDVGGIGCVGVGRRLGRDRRVRDARFGLGENSGIRRRQARVEIRPHVDELARHAGAEPGCDHGKEHDQQPESEALQDANQWRAVHSGEGLDDVAL